VNLLTAKAMGAAEVVVTDINEGRLEVAKTLGADHVYKVCTYKSLVVCIGVADPEPEGSDAFGRIQIRSGTEINVSDPKLDPKQNL
jgi:threonine dehydrogenase-like Zn-dependent dehydrogenase